MEGCFLLDWQAPRMLFRPEAAADLTEQATPSLHSAYSDAET